jgi:glycosyltransferase involved in cell wall biosynthesis
VLDGVTGILLDPAAQAPAYVARILALRADPAAYRRMAIAGRDRFETLLNWDAMAARLIDIFESGIAERSH